MDQHEVVSHLEWLEARQALLAKEREFSHQQEDLARRRRAMTGTTADRRAAGAATARASASPIAMLVAAIGAWIGTVIWARRTGNGPGTMGLGLFPFVGMWALMMTAMMLPAVAGTPGFGRYSPPVASGPGQSRIRPRALIFTAEYLLVWALTGLPAYGLATMEGNLAGHHPNAAIAAAAALLAVAGLYQFTPAKRTSLPRCHRAVLPAGVHRGLGAGVAFGGWCLACSWAAMVLMIVLGVMNVAAMVVVAVVVFVERRWFWGGASRGIIGAAILAGGVLVVAWPSLAAGVHHMTTM